MKKILLVIFISLILSGCTANLGNNNSKGANPRDFTKEALVKSFPPIPFHPDLKVIESYQDGNRWGANFATDKKVEELIEYYQKGLSQTGWNGSLRRQSDTSNNYVFVISNNEYEGEIIINTADDGKQSALSAFVSKK